ncbi:MAG: XrtA-associated tyrosine autokinase [Burkholderiaceae bacterium]
MNFIERAAARLTRKSDDSTIVERAMRANVQAAPKRPSKPRTRAEADRVQSLPKVVRLHGEDPPPRPSGAALRGTGAAVLEQPPVPRSPRRAPSPIEIDLADLRARGFVTPDESHTPVAQAFRVIKRPLIANAIGRGATTIANGRRVMVTSSLPDEGKSFCAINLAMSIAAERDHQVLLVDADVARPSLPRELKVRTGAGLMDWLVDNDIDVDELVVPTNIDKLSMLPAGRHHIHSTELIASGAMNRVLDRLSARFPDHIIVFDSPPLLNTTESRVLASYMGQIVMVVEASRTPREAVDEALETLPDDAVVGLVLNKSRDSRGSKYYYGYR